MVGIICRVEAVSVIESEGIDNRVGRFVLELRFVVDDGVTDDFIVVVVERVLVVVVMLMLHVVVVGLGVVIIVEG